MAKMIRIGGGHAHYEDTMDGYAAMLDSGVDYIICDFLAEFTMAVLAKDVRGNPDGYSPTLLRDFRPWMKPILGKGTKLVTNWGGLNPKGAAEALRAMCGELGLAPRIAVVEGDDLRDRAEALHAAGLKDMFNGHPLPDKARIASINAYLGAFPIASALAAGADIVITGRVVDSALALGPLIHEFGWAPGDLDRLAAGTLAGHLLECSSQVTGGIFTDWELVPGWADMAKPIAECHEDGRIVLTKAEASGGMVSVGTVAEQMIYEVGDPQAYIVPDVVCDFSGVRLTEIGPHRIEISGVKGRKPPSQYKVCTIYDEGWRGRVFVPIIGTAAAAKANRNGRAIFERTNRMLRDRNSKPLNDGHVELLGAESAFGARSRQRNSREVVAMMTADHDEREGIEIFLKEQLSAGTSMAPGTSINILSGTGTGAIPLSRMFAFLIDKSKIAIRVTMDGKSWEVPVETGGGFDPGSIAKPAFPAPPADADTGCTVPLIALAWARSGDKGNLFNVGVIARRPEYAPYIAASLTPEAVRDWFAHLFDPSRPARVDRYVMPGSHGLNFVVHDSLDGGVSSAKRFDPLGKSMAQNLLEIPIAVSRVVAQACAAEQERREAEYEALM
jgi:hypothetical protein